MNHPTTTHDRIPDLVRISVEGRPLWLRIVMVAGVVVCFALGVVGWLVPVVTGVPFYVLGLVLLAKVSRRAGRRINAWERRLPPKLRRWLRPGWRDPATTHTELPRSDA